QLLEFAGGGVDGGGEFGLPCRLRDRIVGRELGDGFGGALAAGETVVALDGFARGVLEHARDVAFEAGGGLLGGVAFGFETGELQLDHAELAGGYGFGGAQRFDGGAGFEFGRRGAGDDGDVILLVRFRSFKGCAGGDRFLDC